MSELSLKKYRKSLSVMFIATCALTLMACSSSNAPAPAIQQSLLTECGELPRLSGGTGSDVLPVMIQWAAMYNECAERHNALAGELSKR